MPKLPGCYTVIELGKSTSTPSGPKLNLKDLNFTVVLNEDDAPLTERYTTWGMAAEAATLYQANNQPNQLLIGDAGNVYLLREDRQLDGGRPITMSWQSGPLPEPGENTPALAPKRIHEFWWQIDEDPRRAGFEVTVTFTDVDDPTNVVVTSIIQRTRKARVIVGLRCRQFQVSLTVTTRFDYAITQWGIRGQIMSRPYTGKQ